MPSENQGARAKNQGVELYQTSLLCNPEQYNHFGFPNEYEIPFIICVSSSSILFQVLLFKIDGLESAIVLILGMACCCVNYFCLKEASPETCRTEDLPPVIVRRHFILFS